LVVIGSFAAVLHLQAGSMFAAGHAYQFEPTVESLKMYKCPEWFRDAKFGIYLHWGVYSVAEHGEWYPRNMYIEGSQAYKHHIKTYGHPSKFGYKDFIPMWRAENFDPHRLVALFKREGAKYFYIH
jgi:alpha-L-fucosidase